MGRSLKVVLLKQTNMKLLLVLAAAGLSCATPRDPKYLLKFSDEPAVEEEVPRDPKYLLKFSGPPAVEEEVPRDPKYLLKFSGPPAVYPARKKREADPDIT